MFNIEEQYQVYLKKVGLDESEMIDVQKKQLRETFFGALGMLSVILQDKTINPIDLADNIRKQASQFFITNNRLN